MSLDEDLGRLLDTDLLYDQWRRERRYWAHEHEALTAPPAKVTKTFGTNREHIDLLVSLLHVMGHVLWLSIDDSSKRFALLELR